jgi:hypothetical protein
MPDATNIKLGQSVSDILRRVNGTAAVDSLGRPLVLHHGTFASFDQFRVTRDVGYHFGDHEAATSRRRRALLRPLYDGGDPHWRVISACLDIKNPVFLESDPNTWHGFEILAALKGAITVDQHTELSAAIATEKKRSDLAWKRLDDLIEERMSAFTIDDATVQRFRKRPRRTPITVEEAIETLTERKRAKVTQETDDEHPDWIPDPGRERSIIKNWLICAGYDGIAYVNWFENRRSISWVAFDDSAIVQIGEDLPFDSLPVTAKDMARTSYRPGKNPSWVPRLGSRTRNQPTAWPVNRNALAKALVNRSMTNQHFNKLYQIKEAHAQNPTQRLGFGGREYLLYPHHVQGWEFAFDQLPQVGAAKTTHFVEWPLYATPDEVSEMVLAQIVALNESDPHARIVQDRLQSSLDALAGRRSCVTSPDGSPLILHSPHYASFDVGHLLDQPMTDRAAAIRALSSRSYRLQRLRRDNKFASTDCMHAAILVSERPLILDGSATPMGMTDKFDHRIAFAAARLLDPTREYLSRAEFRALEARWQALDMAERQLQGDENCLQPLRAEHFRAYLDILQSMSAMLMVRGYDALCLRQLDFASPIWLAIDPGALIKLPDNVIGDVVSKKFLPDSFQAIENPSPRSGGEPLLELCWPKGAPDLEITAQSDMELAAPGGWS